MADQRIVIAGAGSVGCFVGGLLAASGTPVAFLARERVVDELGRNGLRLTDLDGLDVRLAPGRLELSSDPKLLGSANLILVTVKSGATAAMAQLIAAHGSPTAAVVSLQNGVANAERLRTLLPGRQVLSGMVPFNILHRAAGHYHRGTSGHLLIEADQGGLAAALSVPDLAVEAHPDMQAVQWGKLVLNLNNALNALSGLPLKQQLLDRRWRKVLARQQSEALELLDIAGIRPWSMGPLPIRWLPSLLRLPTPLFRLLAGAAVRIDPVARSSMWEDLERGRKTEVDELQGAIVALAAQLGRQSPVSARIRALVHTAERDGTGSPRLDPEQVANPQ